MASAETDDDPCKGYGQRRCPRCGSLTHVDTPNQNTALVSEPVRRCNDDECPWHVVISGTSNLP